MGRNLSQIYTVAKYNSDLNICFPYWYFRKTNVVLEMLFSTKEKIKQEQKIAAARISELKALRKSSPNGHVPELDAMHKAYRLKHVAYCMFFNNTKYKAIERNPHIPLTESRYRSWLVKWTDIMRELIFK